MNLIGNGDIYTLIGTTMALILKSVLTSGVFGIIGWCILYYKINEPAWIPIVPIYNSYYQFKKFWTTRPFWLTLVFVVGIFAGSIILTFGASGQGSPLVAGLGTIILIASCIGVIVIRVILKWKEATTLSPVNYVAVFCGLLLIAPIFTLIYSIIYPKNGDMTNSNQI